MLIDTHAHLDYAEYDADREAVIRRAIEAGVTRIICIGTSLASSHRAVALAARYEPVFAAVGIHPGEAGAASGDWITELKFLAGKPKVVAIGETGLDFHRLPSASMNSPFQDALSVEVAQDPAEVEQTINDDAYKNTQADIFEAQLDLAAELGLNVILHQRDSWDEMLEILKPFTGKLRGVFHCFGETPEQAATLFAMGHLVSFTGIVTFKNAEAVRTTVGAVPAEKFMVETDCPYLAPIPHRGKRCEPAFTREVAERIASVRGVSLEEIARLTTATAEGFFRFA
jgi:TatD DNase family protein